MGRTWQHLALSGAPRSSESLRRIMSQNQHGLTKAEYLRFREPYLPTPCKVISVFESPPHAGKYFYNPNGLAGSNYSRNDEANFGHQSKVQG
jgi:hypothetical protein